MATKLSCRNTANNGIGSFLDAIVGDGASNVTGVVNTTASGTNIQWTATAGGSVLEWISGRSPAGGWTLSGSVSVRLFALESATAANCGGRIRLYKRTSGGTETELGGSPWNDGVEFGTTNALMSWSFTPTSMSFAENDRLVIRFFITNVGTMGGSRTCTMRYNNTAANSGDTSITLTETISFKAEERTGTLDVSQADDTLAASGEVVSSFSDPSDLNPLVWLDPNSGSYSGSNLSSLTDQGSNAGSYTINGTIAKGSSVGALDTLRIDSTSKFLELPVTQNAGVLTAVYAGKLLSVVASGAQAFYCMGWPGATGAHVVYATTDGGLFAFGNGCCDVNFNPPGIRINSGNINDTDFHTLIVQLGSTRKVWLDGAPLSIDDGTGGSVFGFTSATCRFGIADLSSETLNGDLAGVLLFNRSLSDGEVADLDGWFQDQAAGGSAEGTLSVSQEGDTISATGSVLVEGTLSVSQAGDTLAASGGVLVEGTLSVAQVGDTLAASADLIVQGSLSAAQEADTLASAGTVSDPAITGTLDVTQEGDTLSASGDVIAQGTVTASQADNTLSATGRVLVQATATAAQADHTLAASAKVLIQGTVTASQADQTLAASADVVVTGQASVVQDAQTLSGSAKALITGTMTAQQEGDTLFASTQQIASGSLSVVQDDNSISASAETPKTGTLSATQDDQTLVSLGEVRVSGGVTALQQGDSVVGFAEVLIEGVFFAGQEDQALAAFANVPIFGSLMTSQEGDTLAGLGDATESTSPARHSELDAVVSRLEIDLDAVAMKISSLDAVMIGPSVLDAVVSKPSLLDGTLTSGTDLSAVQSGPTTSE